MKKTIITAICVILVLLLPIGGVIGIAAALPEQYGNVFTSRLSEKYDRLNSIDEPKVIVVGGSSVAFGLDSELLEEYMGMPVVNFGLYAALGTKVMMDLSKSNIGEGDIIVLAPELDAQTLSLYFNAENTLMALDGSFYMLKDIAVSNYVQLLGGVWKFAGEKLSYYLSGNKPDPEGVYNSKNFNEYGDIVYDRPENTMPRGYDRNMLIDLSESIVSQDFIDYVNDYIRYCEKKGATVYFSYCPINDAALAGGAGVKADGTMNKDALSQQIADFQSYLKDNINCKFISEISDYIMEAGYFYDTNFHMNDAGVTAHTVTLIKDLLLETGSTASVTTEVPEAPALPEQDVIFEGEDENAKYFTFERLESGSYAITGLTAEGLEMKTLTVPLGYDGYKVTDIKAGAFASSKLETLILTEDTNIVFFEGDTFTGASRLKDMYIYQPNGDLISPPTSVAGTASGFVIHVPLGSNYADGYYWSQIGATFRLDAESR